MDTDLAQLDVVACNAMIHGVLVNSLLLIEGDVINILRGYDEGQWGVGGECEDEVCNVVKLKAGGGWYRRGKMEAPHPPPDWK